MASLPPRAFSLKDPFLSQSETIYVYMWLRFYFMGVYILLKAVSFSFLTLCLTFWLVN
nr:hypothetical protein Q903MT_gene2012 [Picea sitchensis]